MPDSLQVLRLDWQPAVFLRTKTHLRIFSEVTDKNDFVNGHGTLRFAEGAANLALASLRVNKICSSYKDFLHCFFNLRDLKFLI